MPDVVGILSDILYLYLDVDIHVFTNVSKTVTVLLDKCYRRWK